MKLCKVFLKPGLPAVRCMVRFPVPPPAYSAPRPAGQAALRAAFGGGLRPPPTPRPSAGAALRARLPQHPPPRRLHRPPRPSLPSRTFRRGAARRPPGAAAAYGRRGGSAAGAAPLRSGSAAGAAPHAQTTPMHPPAAHPPPQGALPCGNGPDGLHPPPAAPPPPLRGPRYPPRPLFPLKSPQSLANAAKIRIIKWYISYRKGEQKLWQIKRKW